MSKKMKRKLQNAMAAPAALTAQCFLIVKGDGEEYFDTNGKSYFLNALPPGAMYFADWYPDCWKGVDGHALTVVCPGGKHWCIDSQANNCTMKEDIGPYDKHHRCWVRHGIPPNITVDKNGRTCKAGAGSIQTENYHGRLINGVFVP